MKKLFDDDERTPFAFALLIFVVLLAFALGANERQSEPGYWERFYEQQQEDAN